MKLNNSIFNKNCKIKPKIKSSSSLYHFAVDKNEAIFNERLDKINQGCFVGKIPESALGVQSIQEAGDKHIYFKILSFGPVASSAKDDINFRFKGTFETYFKNREEIYPKKCKKVLTMEAHNHNNRLVSFSEFEKVIDKAAERILLEDIDSQEECIADSTKIITFKNGKAEGKKFVYRPSPTVEAEVEARRIFKAAEYDLPGEFSILEDRFGKFAIDEYIDNEHFDNYGGLASNHVRAEQLGRIVTLFYLLGHTDTAWDNFLFIGNGNLLPIDMECAFSFICYSVFTKFYNYILGLEYVLPKGIFKWEKEILISAYGKGIKSQCRIIAAKKKQFREMIVAVFKKEPWTRRIVRNTRDYLNTEWLNGCTPFFLEKADSLFWNKQAALNRLEELVKIGEAKDSDIVLEKNKGSSSLSTDKHVVALFRYVEEVFPFIHDYCEQEFSGSYPFVCKYGNFILAAFLNKKIDSRFIVNIHKVNYWNCEITIRSELLTLEEHVFLTVSDKQEKELYYSSIFDTMIDVLNGCCPVGVFNSRNLKVSQECVEWSKKNRKVEVFKLSKDVNTDQYLRDYLQLHLTYPRITSYDYALGCYIPLIDRFWYFLNKHNVASSGLFLKNSNQQKINIPFYQDKSVCWDEFSDEVSQLKQMKNLQVAIVVGRNVDLSGIDIKVDRWSDCFRFTKGIESAFLLCALQNIEQHVSEGIAMVIRQENSAKNKSNYSILSIIDNGCGFIDAEKRKLSVKRAVNGYYPKENGEAGICLRLSVWRARVTLIKIPGEIAIIRSLKHRVGSNLPGFKFVFQEVNNQEYGTVISGYFFEGSEIEIDNQQEEIIKSLLNKDNSENITSVFCSSAIDTAKDYENFKSIIKKMEQETGYRFLSDQETLKQNTKILDKVFILRRSASDGRVKIGRGGKTTKFSKHKSEYYLEFIKQGVICRVYFLENEEDIKLTLAIDALSKKIINSFSKTITKSEFRKMVSECKKLVLKYLPAKANGQIEFARKKWVKLGKWAYGCVNIEIEQISEKAGTKDGKITKVINEDTEEEELFYLIVNQKTEALEDSFYSEIPDVALKEFSDHVIRQYILKESGEVRLGGKVYAQFPRDAGSEIEVRIIDGKPDSVIFIRDREGNPILDIRGNRLEYNLKQDIRKQSRAKDPRVIAVKAVSLKKRKEDMFYVSLDEMCGKLRSSLEQAGFEAIDAWTIVDGLWRGMEAAAAKRKQSEFIYNGFLNSGELKALRTLRKAGFSLIAERFYKQRLEYYKNYPNLSPKLVVFLIANGISLSRLRVRINDNELTIKDIENAFTEDNSLKRVSVILSTRKKPSSILSRVNGKEEEHLPSWQDRFSALKGFLEKEGISQDICIAVSYAVCSKIVDSRKLKYRLRFFQKYGFLTEKECRLLIKRKYIDWERFSQRIAEEYRVLINSSQKFTEKQVKLILKRGFSEQAACDLKNKYRKYGITKSELVQSMCNQDPEKYLGKLIMPRARADGNRMIFRRHLEDEIGVFFLPAERNEIIDGLLEFITGRKWEHNEVFVRKLNKLTQCNTITLKQKNMLLNIGRYASEAFTNQFKPKDVAQRIKQNMILYLDPSLQNGLVTPRQALFLVVRGYLYPEFKSIMNEYCLTKTELLEVIHGYSNPGEILEKLRPQRINYLHRKTKLPEYFIKIILIKRGSKITDGYLEDLLKEAKYLIKTYAIPVYIALNWYIRGNNAQSFKQRVVGLSRQEGLPIRLTYHLFFQRELTQKDINRNIIMLSESCGRILQEKKVAYQKMQESLSALEKDIYRDVSFVQAVIIRKKIEQLVKARPNNEILNGLKKEFGVKYHILQELVDLIFNQLKNDNLSEAIYSGARNKGVSLAVYRIVEARKEIKKIAKTASKEITDFQNNNLMYLYQKRKKASVRENSELKKCLSEKIVQRISGKLGGVLEESVIIELGEKIISGFFNTKNGKVKNKLERFRENGSLTLQQCALVESHRWQVFSRENWLDRLSDNLVFDVSRLKREFDFSDSLVINIILKGYYYSWICELYRQYPHLKKSFLDRMFRAEFPEKYLLCHCGPLDREVKAAQVFMKELTKSTDFSLPKQVEELLSQDYTYRQLVVLVLNARVNHSESNISLGKQAARYFVQAHLSIAEEIAKEYRYRYCSRQCIQEGTTALYEALKSYTPDYQSENGFPEHARKFIKQRYEQILKMTRKDYQNQNYHSVSIDAPAYGDSSRITKQEILGVNDIASGFGNNLHQLNPEDNIIFSEKAQNGSIKQKEEREDLRKNIFSDVARKLYQQKNISSAWLEILLSEINQYSGDSEDLSQQFNVDVEEVEKCLKIGLAKIGEHIIAHPELIAHFSISAVSEVKQKKGTLQYEEKKGSSSALKVVEHLCCNEEFIEITNCASYRHLRSPPKKIVIPECSYSLARFFRLSFGRASSPVNQDKNIAFKYNQNNPESIIAETFLARMYGNINPDRKAKILWQLLLGAGIIPFWQTAKIISKTIIFMVWATFCFKWNQKYREQFFKTVKEDLSCRYSKTAYIGNQTTACRVDFKERIQNRKIVEEFTQCIRKIFSSVIFIWCFTTFSCLMKFVDTLDGRAVIVYCFGLPEMVLFFVILPAAAYLFLINVIYNIDVIVRDLEKSLAIETSIISRKSSSNCDNSSSSSIERRYTSSLREISHIGEIIRELIRKDPFAAFSFNNEKLWMQIVPDKSNCLRYVIYPEVGEVRRLFFLRALNKPVGDPFVAPSGSLGQIIFFLNNSIEIEKLASGMFLEVQSNIWLRRMNPEMRNLLLRWIISAVQHIISAAHKEGIYDFYASTPKFIKSIYLRDGIRLDQGNLKKHYQRPFRRQWQKKDIEVLDKYVNYTDSNIVPLWYYNRESRLLKSSSSISIISGKEPEPISAVKINTNPLTSSQQVYLENAAKGRKIPSYYLNVIFEKFRKLELISSERESWDRCRPIVRLEALRVAMANHWIKPGNISFLEEVIRNPLSPKQQDILELILDLELDVRNFSRTYQILADKFKITVNSVANNHVRQIYKKLKVNSGLIKSGWGLVEAAKIAAESGYIKYDVSKYERFVQKYSKIELTVGEKKCLIKQIFGIDSEYVRSRDAKLMNAMSSCNRRIRNKLGIRKKWNRGDSMMPVADYVLRQDMISTEDIVTVAVSLPYITKIFSVDFLKVYFSRKHSARDIKEAFKVFLPGNVEKTKKIILFYICNVKQIIYPLTSGCLEALEDALRVNLPATVKQFGPTVFFGLFGEGEKDLGALVRKLISKRVHDFNPGDLSCRKEKLARVSIKEPEEEPEEEFKTANSANVEEIKMLTKFFSPEEFDPNLLYKVGEKILGNGFLLPVLEEKIDFIMGLLLDRNRRHDYVYAFLILKKAMEDHPQRTAELFIPHLFSKQLPINNDGLPFIEKLYKERNGWFDYFIHKLWPYLSQPLKNDISQLQNHKSLSSTGVDYWGMSSSSINYKNYNDYVCTNKETIVGSSAINNRPVKSFTELNKEEVFKLVPKGSRRHTRNVIRLVGQIGNVVGLAQKELCCLKYLACAHDIGKGNKNISHLFLSSEIWDKNAKERRLARKHSRYTVVILEKHFGIQLPHGERQIIFWHNRLKAINWKWVSSQNKLFWLILIIADIIDGSIDTSRKHKVGKNLKFDPAMTLKRIRIVVGDLLSADDNVKKIYNVVERLCFNEEFIETANRASYRHLRSPPEEIAIPKCGDSVSKSVYSGWKNGKAVSSSAVFRGVNYSASKIDIKEISIPNIRNHHYQIILKKTNNGNWPGICKVWVNSTSVGDLEYWVRETLVVLRRFYIKRKYRGEGIGQTVMHFIADLVWEKNIRFNTKTLLGISAVTDAVLVRTFCNAIENIVYGSLDDPKSTDKEDLLSKVNSGGGLNFRGDPIGLSALYPKEKEWPIFFESASSVVNADYCSSSLPVSISDELITEIKVLRRRDEPGYSNFMQLLDKANSYDIKAAIDRIEPYLRSYFILLLSKKDPEKLILKSISPMDILPLEKIADILSIDSSAFMIAQSADEYKNSISLYIPGETKLVKIFIRSLSMLPITISRFADNREPLPPYINEFLGRKGVKSCIIHDGYRTRVQLFYGLTWRFSIDYFELDSSLWGKGIGDILYVNLERYAKECGFTVISVEGGCPVEPKSEVFFARQGFSESFAIRDEGGRESNPQMTFIVFKKIISSAFADNSSSPMDKEDYKDFGQKQGSKEQAANEKEEIENALRKTRVRNEAAKIFGISPAQFYRKIKKHGIDLNTFSKKKGRLSDITKEKMEELIIRHKGSVAAIAYELKVSGTAVSLLLKKYGQADWAKEQRKKYGKIINKKRFQMMMSSWKKNRKTAVREVTRICFGEENINADDEIFFWEKENRIKVTKILDAVVKDIIGEGFHVIPEIRRNKFILACGLRELLVSAKAASSRELLKEAGLIPAGNCLDGLEVSSSALFNFGWRLALPVSRAINHYSLKCFRVKQPKSNLIVIDVKIGKEKKGCIKSLSSKRLILSAGESLPFKSCEIIDVKSIEFIEKDSRKKSSSSLKTIGFGSSDLSFDRCHKEAQRLIKTLQYKGIPWTDAYMRVLPEVEKVTKKYPDKWFISAINLGIAITKEGLLPCPILYYGVGLAVISSNASFDQYKQNLNCLKYWAEEISRIVWKNVNEEGEKYNFRQISTTKSKNIIWRNTAYRKIDDSLKSIEVNGITSSRRLRTALDESSGYSINWPSSCLVTFCSDQSEYKNYIIRFLSRCLGNGHSKNVNVKERLEENVSSSSVEIVFNSPDWEAIRNTELFSVVVPISGRTDDYNIFYQKTYDWLLYFFRLSLFKEQIADLLSYTLAEIFHDAVRKNLDLRAAYSLSGFFVLDNSTECAPVYLNAEFIQKANSQTDYQWLLSTQKEYAKQGPDYLLSEKIQKNRQDIDDDFRYGLAQFARLIYELPCCLKYAVSSIAPFKTTVEFTVKIMNLPDFVEKDVPICTLKKEKLQKAKVLLTSELSKWKNQLDLTLAFSGQENREHIFFRKGLMQLSMKNLISLRTFEEIREVLLSAHKIIFKIHENIITLPSLSGKEKLKISSGRLANINFNCAFLKQWLGELFKEIEVIENIGHHSNGKAKVRTLLPKKVSSSIMKAEKEAITSLAVISCLTRGEEELSLLDTSFYFPQYLRKKTSEFVYGSNNPVSSSAVKSNEYLFGLKIISMKIIYSENPESVLEQILQLSMRFAVEDGEMLMTKEYIKDEIENDSKDFNLAFVDAAGVIIGYLLTQESPRHPNALWFTFMGVEKERRNKGFAKMMMKIAALKAVEYNIERIKLGVRKENKIAIAMYERCGFQRDPITYFKSEKEEINFQDYSETMSKKYGFKMSSQDKITIDGVGYEFVDFSAVPSEIVKSIINTSSLELNEEFKESRIIAFGLNYNPRLTSFLRVISTLIEVYGRFKEKDISLRIVRLWDEQELNFEKPIECYTFQISHSEQIKLVIESKTRSKEAVVEAMNIVACLLTQPEFENGLNCRNAPEKQKFDELFHKFRIILSLEGSSPDSPLSVATAASPKSTSSPVNKNWRQKLINAADDLRVLKLEGIILSRLSDFERTILQKRTEFPPVDRKNVAAELGYPVWKVANIERMLSVKVPALLKLWKHADAVLIALFNGCRVNINYIGIKNIDLLSRMIEPAVRFSKKETELMKFLCQIIEYREQKSSEINSLIVIKREMSLGIFQVKPSTWRIFVQNFRGTDDPLSSSSLVFSSSLSTEIEEVIAQTLTSVASPVSISEKRIRKVRIFLKEHLNPNIIGIIVHGSTARGDALEESDFDFGLIKINGDFTYELTQADLDFHRGLLRCLAPVKVDNQLKPLIWKGEEAFNKFVSLYFLERKYATAIEDVPWVNKLEAFIKSYRIIARNKELENIIYQRIEDARKSIMKSVRNKENKTAFTSSSIDGSKRQRINNLAEYKRLMKLNAQLLVRSNTVSSSFPAEKDGEVERSLISVDSFMDFTGPVYYPASELDLESMVWLARLFPKLKMLMYVDVLDPDEMNAATVFKPEEDDGEGVSGAFRYYGPDDMSLLQRQMQNKLSQFQYHNEAIIDYKNTGVDIISVEDMELLLKVSFKRNIKKAPWLNSRVIEINFLVCDIFDYKKIFNVIYVNYPGYCGGLARVEEFWVLMRKQISEQGCLLETNIHRKTPKTRVFKKKLFSKTDQIKLTQYPRIDVLRPIKIISASPLNYSNLALGSVRESRVSSTISHCSKVVSIRKLTLADFDVSNYSSSSVSASSNLVTSSILGNLYNMRNMFIAYQDILSSSGKMIQAWVNESIAAMYKPDIRSKEIRRAKKITELMPDPQRISLTDNGRYNWFGWFNLENIDVWRILGFGCIDPCQFCLQENVKSKAVNYPLPVIIKLVIEENPAAQFNFWHNNEPFQWYDPFFKSSLDGLIEFTVRRYPHMFFYVTTRGFELSDCRSEKTARNICNLVNEYPQLKNRIFNVSFHLCLGTLKYDIIRAIAYRGKQPEIFNQVRKNYIERYRNIFSALNSAIQRIYIYRDGPNNFLGEINWDIFAKATQEIGRHEWQVESHTIGNHDSYNKSRDFINRLKQAFNGKYVRASYMRIQNRDFIPEDNVPQIETFKSGKVIIRSNGEEIARSTLVDLDYHPEAALRINGCGLGVESNYGAPINVQ